MCGRYYRTSDKQAIADALHAQAIGDPLAYAPGYNIAPTTIQPVLRQERETYQRELVPMRWGLVGFGSNGIDPKRSTFNARAEGLENSSLWKRPLHRQRCIVPMNGYYEWRKSDRQAFRFTVGENNQPFGVAGLWDAWKSPEGDWLQSFSIITTDPNEISASIHNRMPVILHPKDYDEWLDRQEVERPPVHLLRPFESIGMCIYNAHPKVGNVRNQGPEMLNSE
jgi:putative SOS response-associated peptidase YedK